MKTHGILCYAHRIGGRRRIVQLEADAGGRFDRARWDEMFRHRLQRWRNEQSRGLIYAWRPVSVKVAADDFRYLQRFHRQQGGPPFYDLAAAAGCLEFRDYDTNELLTGEAL